MAGALFLPSALLTARAASEQATAPAKNLLNDVPGMVWRSTDLNNPYVTIAVSGSVDTIALVGSNLRATDTVRARGSASSDMSSPVFDVTVQAWSGVTPKAGAFTLIQLGAPVTAAFVRLDITSTGNPSGYVQASRLVVGQRLDCAGVSVGAEKGFNDGSVTEEALGSTIIDPYRTRDTWKVSVSNVGRITYWSNWEPFFRTMGIKRAFLFVPDTDPSCLQNQACFVRITSSAKSTWNAYECCNLDINMTEV